MGIDTTGHHQSISESELLASLLKSLETISHAVVAMNIRFISWGAGEVLQYASQCSFGILMETDAYR